MFKENFDLKKLKNSHVKHNSSKLLAFQTPCSTLLKWEDFYMLNLWKWSVVNTGVIKEPPTKWVALKAMMFWDIWDIYSDQTGDSSLPQIYGWWFRNPAQKKSWDYKYCQPYQISIDIPIF